ncbi:YusW family protein [Salisediminibacterium selenitireducens]|uniref:Lipoprotein n=1 Tax=Bacillus selenitireducens (strain ATCC 700615 / DSM 15326 / MLS10) TaxID=439292 RepID=D6XZ67_BACIE|nr:YusW family protein [Salisediminibacterium selenitireducens]ADI00352.1 hypothetical protein Bsel_2862 [[Bacillus] selenitireducens MLS10]
MIHPLILLISILLLSACSPFAPDITNENEPNEGGTSQSVIQEEEDPDENTEEPGHAGMEIQSVMQFELDLVLEEEDDWHFFYELEPDGFQATVEGAQPDQVVGDDAFTEVEALLTRLSVTTEHSITGIVSGVTSALNTDIRDIESFSLVLVTTQGERFEFAFEDLSGEDRLEDASAFRFENRLYSGETMVMAYGESEPSTVEEPNGDALRGAQADELIRQYLADMAFAYDMPLAELKHAMLTPVNIEADEVADFTLEASFADGYLRIQHVY